MKNANLFSLNRNFLYKNQQKQERNQKKIYPRDYNLLMKQDLWQAHYKILLIILLMEFIKLNVSTDTMIKKVKLVDLNTKIASVFLLHKV